MRNVRLRYDAGRSEQQNDTLKKSCKKMRQTSTDG